MKDESRLYLHRVQIERAESVEPHIFVLACESGELSLPPFLLVMVVLGY